jgi:hypothetical protein
LEEEICENCTHCHDEDLDNGTYNPEIYCLYLEGYINRNESCNHYEEAE